MKRWAFVTVSLYVLVLVLLAAPVLLFCLVEWKSGLSVDLDDVLAAYQTGWFWGVLGLMGLAQALLLLVPVRVAERRPVSRRPLAVPIVTTAFLLGLLSLAGLLCVCLAIGGDKGLWPFTFPAEHAARTPPIGWVLATPGLQFDKSNLAVWTFLATFGVFWLSWGLLFARYALGDSPEGLTQRATRWLLRGSILELLVAVPSHLIVRHRGDCCAPAGTAAGICTGICLMLLCFGPGVLLLFLQRFGRLRARPRPALEPPPLAEPSR